VLIKQIDVVGLQPAQRTFDGLADVCRPAVHAGDTLLVELEAELGRDDDAVTRGVELLERASEQLLVRVRAVRLGCVEERHAEFDGALNGGDGFPLVALFGGAIRLAHSHEP
jgi:hypothetical protein